MIAKKITDSQINDVKTQELACLVVENNISNKTVIEETTHKNQQLLYVPSGFMQLRALNEVLLISSGQAVIIPAGIAYSLEALSDVAMCTVYLEASEVPPQHSEMNVFTVSKLVHELITALSCESFDESPNIRGDKIVALMEVELNLAESSPFIIPMPKDSRLNYICSRLIQNPSQNKTLNEWGNECGASERTLSRLFSKELGMNYRSWRQLVRVHYALDLFTEKKSIKQVVTTCGYRSYSAFTSAFQSHIGVTPSALNKLLV